MFERPALYIHGCTEVVQLADAGIGLIEGNVEMLQVLVTLLVWLLVVLVALLAQDRDREVRQKQAGRQLAPACVPERLSVAMYSSEVLPLYSSLCKSRSSTRLRVQHYGQVCHIESSAIS